MHMIRRGISHLLLLLIRGYQLLLSPLFGTACRFHPSCSAYAAEALTQHGIMKGCGLTAKRLLRCHPWGGSGDDPVPSPRHGKGSCPAPKKRLDTTSA